MDKEVTLSLLLEKCRASGMDVPRRGTLPGAVFDTKVNGVTDDSRNVMKGGMFVAVSGAAVDGRRFIPTALKNGAAVVVQAAAPGEAHGWSWRRASYGQRLRTYVGLWGICLQLGMGCLGL